MARFDRAYVVPGRPETIGATLASAKALAEIGEACILLQEPRTENVITEIGRRGSYLCYTDMFEALGQRYIREDPPSHRLSQDIIDQQASLQWKRYIKLLQPSLYTRIEELKHGPGIQDPDVTWSHYIPGKTFSRSLVYRTIISREGLEDLRLSKELRKRLGKQTVATLDMLLDIPPSQVGN